MIFNINYQYKCCANSSRFFKSFAEAKNQPQANINLQLDKGTGIIYNSDFKSELIYHDSAYCTSDSTQLNNTWVYLERLIKRQKPGLVVDIGCGQGELVEKLNTYDIKAIGFDPTLRKTNENLFKQYYDSNIVQNFHRKIGNGQIIFILRCVLPHLKNPFSFLDDLLEKFPQSKILIEFQDTNWILKKKLWSSISHDHVNYFRLKNFSYNFRIIESSTFSEMEWRYVFLEYKKNKKKRYGFLIYDKVFLSYRFRKLKSQKKRDLLALKILRAPIIYIYGAAAKSMQVCFELNSMLVHNIRAIDQNYDKTGLFMEASGVKVFSIDTVKQESNLKTLIVVVNQNHFNFVKHQFPNFNVQKIGDIKEPTGN